MTRPTLEIVVQAFKFAKRVSWMCYSLAQQTGDHPDIQVRIDAHQSDPYLDKIILLQAQCEKALHLQTHVHTSSKFGQRGWLRGEALKDTAADWILFADGDLVFPPGFWAEVWSRFVSKPQFQDRLLQCLRWSIERDASYGLVDSWQYDGIVRDAYQKFELMWSLHPGKKSKHPTGSFQLCRVDVARERGGYMPSYAIPEESILQEEGSGAVSDVHFRKKWGASKRIVFEPLDKNKPLLHIEHHRRFKYFSTWKEHCL